MILVGGEDQKVAEWAGAVLGVNFVHPLAAFGIVEPDGLLKGAAIFNDYYVGGNIELTYFGPGTITRAIIRDLCRYAFEQNKVSRVTCKTKRSNLVTRRLLPKLGFTLEGTAKRYYGTAKGDDALIFVLSKEHATKWLGA